MKKPQNWNQGKSQHSVVIMERKIKEYLDRAVLAFVAILHCNKLRRNDLRNITPYLA